MPKKPVFTSFTHKFELNIEHAAVGLVFLDGSLDIQALGPASVGPHACSPGLGEQTCARDRW